MFNKHLLNAFCTLIIFTGRTQCFVQIHNPRCRSSFPLLTLLSHVCAGCTRTPRPCATARGNAWAHVVCGGRGRPQVVNV